MSAEQVEYVVQAADAGERLDVVVVRALRGRAGRARVRDLFESGAVLVQGRVATKGWRARAGDVLTVRLASLDPTAVPEPDAPLDVRLERPDLVVVYKPAGQATAPLQPGEQGTLVNALVGKYPETAGIGYGPREPGILHRLDTGTSGLLLAARTPAAFDFLSRDLRSGKIRKEYFVICEGTGLPESGIIDIPIGVDPKHPRRVVPCIRAEEIRRCDPRPARTSYRVEQRSGRWALAIVEAPRAMRHQIRAHFAAIEHPLAGDDLYGGDTGALARHALHARMIGWMGREDVAPFEVTCDLPEDMAAVMREA
jgi:23S rRNA pseudouridine1911/1915/1917 synthase